MVAHLRRLQASITVALHGEPAHLVGALKEHLVWLCRAAPNGADLARRLLRLGTLELLLEGVEEAFGALPPDALDLDAFGHHRLEPRAEATLLNDGP